MVFIVVGTRLHYNEATRYSVNDFAPICIDLDDILMTSGANATDRPQFIIDVIRVDAVLLSD